MDIFIGELMGTMVLILLGDGVVATVLLKNSKGENSGWIVITTGWGLAVAMGVYVAGWVSGAHINPAVTIGLASIGSVPWGQVPVYLAGQFVGAFIGAILVWLAYYQHFEPTEDGLLKRLVFCTSPNIRNYAWNLITEIIGTAMLLIGILGIFNGNNFNGVTWEIGSIAVGFLVWGIGLSLGGPTGYAINPARDLSPRIVHAILPIPGKIDSDWGYSWIPVVGPIIGGVLGAWIYQLTIGAL